MLEPPPRHTSLTGLSWRVGSGEHAVHLHDHDLAAVPCAGDVRTRTRALRTPGDARPR
jgi:hypothetical protein